jgi:riboflavin kinase / FMN adenylyltransferase
VSARPRTYIGLGQVPADLGPTAVTIGVFDGVHRGHQALLRRVVDEAASKGLVPGAITFDRHPLKVVRPGSDPKMLSTLRERVELLGACGMEFVLVLPFTRKLSQMAAEEFAIKVLIEAVSARVIVVGENFRFGHRAAGDARLIAELAGPRGVEVVPVGLDADAGEAISSTRVRSALAEGDVQTVARLLGRPFTVEGRVTVGARRGRLLGVPTANLKLPSGLLLPAKGIYAGHLQVRSSRAADDGAEGGTDSGADSGVGGRADGGVLGPPLPAVSNVGVIPQFGGEELKVETHVLDFDGDLYGRRVRVWFEHRIRDEVVFPDVAALVEQMRDDIARSRRLLGA